MDNLPHISIDEHYEEMEFIQHLCCLKPVKEYYDSEKPSLPTNVGLTVKDNYRKQFFMEGQINTEVNAKMLLCRNDSVIGNILIGKIAEACGKGSAKDKFQKIHISSQLDYNTTSNQKDVSDFYMHTQKNKHQYDKSETRKALWRMCEYNRTEFSNELWYNIDTESKHYVEKKAIDTISNAYRVYKFKEHIQNKINIKIVAQQTLVSTGSRSPSPVSTVSRSLSPVSTVSRSPPPVPTGSRSPSPVSTVSRSPSPVPSNQSSEPLASISLSPVPVPRTSPEPIVETHDEIQIKRIKILTEDVYLNQETRYALNWMLEQHEIKCNEIL